MSIKSVRAIAYRTMEKWRDKHKDSPITAWADQFDNIWIIHITDLGYPKLFKTGEKVLTLEFEDLDPSLFNKGYFDDQSVDAMEMEFGEGALFTEEQAKTVLAFLQKAGSDPNSHDALLVNCMAGISRSGAVVDFARVFFSIDYDQFTRLNPRIVPNTLVRRWLFAVWQEDQNEKSPPLEGLSDTETFEDE